jgi:hypothetical protein
MRVLRASKCHTIAQVAASVSNTLLIRAFVENSDHEVLEIYR